MPFNALFRRVRLHCLTACNCKSLHRHWRYFIHMTIRAGGAYRTVAVSLNCLILQSYEVYHFLTFHMIVSICREVKCPGIDALRVSCHIVRVSKYCHPRGQPKHKSVYATIIDERQVHLRTKVLRNCGPLWVAIPSGT